MTDLLLPTRRSAQLARTSFSQRRTTKRRRVKIDGRSWQAVAIRRLVETYSKALNLPERPAAAAGAFSLLGRVRQLAELEVLTGQMRVAGLGPDAKPDWAFLHELARLENLINRLKASLGLFNPPRRPTPTLAEMKRRYDAKRAAAVSDQDIED